MIVSRDNILSMSPKERQDLLAMLLEIIGHQDYSDTLPEESAEELNLLQERLAEYKTNPAKSIDWEEFYKNETNRVNDAKKED